MEADDVVLEYLRGKLKGARTGRAERIMKPAAEPMEAEGVEMSPEDLAELESLMGAEGKPAPCASCGAEGGCDCPKAE